MATTAPQSQSSRASPASLLDNNASGSDTTLAAAPPPPPANPVGKKNKPKKGATDQTDAARQLQAKIAQLEQDAAGRSEEDAEIGTSHSPRASARVTARDQICVRMAHTLTRRPRSLHRESRPSTDTVLHRTRSQKGQSRSVSAPVQHGIHAQQGRHAATQILGAPGRNETNRTRTHQIKKTRRPTAERKGLATIRTHKVKFDEGEA